MGFSSKRESRKWIGWGKDDYKVEGNDRRDETSKRMCSVGWIRDGSAGSNVREKNSDQLVERDTITGAQEGEVLGNVYCFN